MELPAEDGRLLDTLERGFADARERAGEDLVCTQGCSDCCVGPFPITRLDAVRLRHGLSRLFRDDPRAAGAIIADSRAALARLQSGFPGDFDSGRLDPDRAALDRFFETHDDLPCPVLDRATGSCRLYETRPVSCRTYGPPLRFHDAPAPHCGLCFLGASDDRIEACRWSPDPDDLEREALERIGAGHDEDWAMLIAHAIVRAGEDEGRS